jgi:FAD/FMN-containing dehydrogenase
MGRSSSPAGVSRYSTAAPLALTRRSITPIRDEQWKRLVALKAKFDPTNVFRLNANIPPGGE